MKVGVIVIATNKYLQFVERLLNDLRKHFLNGHSIKVVLFTDHEYDGSDSLDVFRIEHKPWPEPSLKKYNYINLEQEYFKGFDYLFIFDADISLVGDVGEEVLQDLVGVLHPCWIFQSKKLYPYEKRKECNAYIADRHHDKYYAGAFAGGRASTFLKMAKTIAERVEQDEENGVTAIWHDESHLNKYFNENPPTALPPSYMFPEEFIGNSQYPFEPKIVALCKEPSFTQIKVEMGQYPEGTQKYGRLHGYKLAIKNALRRLKS
jgi:histo-blood group ABO system transferase